MKPVKLIMKNFKKEKLPEKETLICCETSFQNLVFEKVIQDKICQKFPPSVTYKKMFLNQYIQILEEERVVTTIIHSLNNLSFF